MSEIRSNEDAEERKFGSPLALIYVMMYPDIQRIAYEKGYAIAVHGSLQRDFDLVAVPWITNPSSPESLISEIASAMNIYHGGNVHGPEIKPGGRLAWTIPMGCGLALDVSVTPFVKE